MNALCSSSPSSSASPDTVSGDDDQANQASSAAAPHGHDDSSVADTVPVINTLTRADTRGGRRGSLTLQQLIRLDFFISGRAVADWGVRGTIPISTVLDGVDTRRPRAKPFFRTRMREAITACIVRDRNEDPVRVMEVLRTLPLLLPVLGQDDGNHFVGGGQNDVRVTQILTEYIRAAR